MGRLCRQDGYWVCWVERIVELANQYTEVIGLCWLGERLEDNKMQKGSKIHFKPLVPEREYSGYVSTNSTE